jgi:NAD(P)-dependent dehydrogenase (short-subunit alcohol dehydrogenase family)
VATLVADVAEEATAEAAVACARREFGGLDVLVSNAVCDLPLAPLTRLTLVDWRRTMAVNLDGAFLFRSGWRGKHHLNRLVARTRRACGRAR